jgi:hypothetical protein
MRKDTQKFKEVNNFLPKKNESKDIDDKSFKNTLEVLLRENKDTLERLAKK